MAYGEDYSRSASEPTSEQSTRSFRKMFNKQGDTLGWVAGKDVPIYYTSDLPNGQQNGYSVDSGYCEWSNGNRIYIGDTYSSGTQPAGLNDGASSRYCYQWTRIGGVVTGSGRVQLGVNGGTTGTSATWLKFGGNTTSSLANEALITSYDIGEGDKNSNAYCVATIPLPVYYQTNENIQSGIALNPPMASRADTTAGIQNSLQADALQGVKKDFNDDYIGGSGTVVGLWYNTIGDEGFDFRPIFPDGTASSAIDPPIANVTGMVHFGYNTFWYEHSLNNNYPARYMNIIVKAVQTPNGSDGGLRNYVPSSSYTGNQYRNILPPMYHFTFSYVLGGYEATETLG